MELKFGPNLGLGTHLALFGCPIPSYSQIWATEKRIPSELPPWHDVSSRHDDPHHLLRDRGPSMADLHVSRARRLGQHAAGQAPLSDIWRLRSVTFVSVN